MNDQRGAIGFDYQTARIDGANPFERIGMGLFRLGAVLGVHLDYNGYSIGAKIVRNILPSRKTVVIDYGNDRKFSFPYGDGYYGILFNTGRPYSPEIEPYFRHLKDESYLFLDCGSNFGYMSSLLSAPVCGSQKCIAIEADHSSYAWTKRNAELNGNRFECLHRAVFSESGQQVTIHGDKHEARSILPDSGAARDGTVETISLGDVAGQAGVSKSDPVILKLDIEGVEIDALKGCSDWLDCPWLIVYEEHGEDKENVVSRYIRDELGMSLWYGGKSGNELIKIESEDQINALKVNARTGYDLFATKSDFWLQKLQSIVELQAAGSWQPASR